MVTYHDLKVKALLKIVQDKIKESLQLLDGNDEYWHEVKEEKNLSTNNVQIRTHIWDKKKNKLWKSWFPFDKNLLEFRFWTGRFQKKLFLNSLEAYCSRLSNDIKEHILKNGQQI